MTTKIVGLTGSIGTGKSTVARMLKRLKIPVQDSDAIVHTLLNFHPPTIDKILHYFPQASHEGQINRQILGRIVFNDPPSLKLLESIIHPEVKAKHIAFIHEHELKGTPLIVLDIPLLFEVGWQTVCHHIVVTACEASVQQARVMARRGMTIDKYNHILQQQWSPDQKIANATWVIHTNISFIDTFKQIKNILRSCI